MIGYFIPIVIFAGSAFKEKIHYEEALENERKEKEKNRAILKLFSKWIQNKESGKAIKDYLSELNIQTIAIYGMSDAGKRLYNELKNTNIKIEYAVDKRVVETEEEILILSPNDELRRTDAIIVTAIYDFPKIAEMLKYKTESCIIPLEQIIYEM